VQAASREEATQVALDRIRKLVPASGYVLSDAVPADGNGNRPVASLAR